MIVTINEDELEEAMTPGMPVDIGLPLALETIFKAKGLRFRTSGTFLRRVELEQPYSVSYRPYDRAWEVDQPAA